MPDAFFILEVNHDVVPVRHGDDETTSVRRPYDLLIGELLLLSEEVLVNVAEDAGDRE